MGRPRGTVMRLPSRPEPPLADPSDDWPDLWRADGDGMLDREQPSSRDGFGHAFRALSTSDLRRRCSEWRVSRFGQRTLGKLRWSWQAEASAPPFLTQPRTRSLSWILRALPVRLGWVRIGGSATADKKPSAAPRSFCQKLPAR